MQTHLDDNFKSRILEEISKSGFPLEIDLIEQLREENFLTFSNVSYSDSMGLIHELDILSIIFSESNEWENGPSGVNLLIECKKSDKYPWVFFEEPYNPVNGVGLLAKADYLSDFANKGDEFNPLISCMHTPLAKHYYNDPNLPTSRTYMEAFKKPNEPTTIYKAVCNVFANRQYLKDWFSKSKNKNKEGRTFLNHHVIVLEGNLILAKKHSEGFELVNADHILLSTIDTLSNKYQKMLDNEIVIDVINKSYVSEYIKLVKDIAWNFNEHLKQINKPDLLDLHK